MLPIERILHQKSGKNNKFQKAIALLFILMYNYSANEKFASIAVKKGVYIL